MSGAEEGRERLLRFFDAIAPWQRLGLEAVGADADATLAAARERFAALVDELPYLDRPEHSLATSIHATAAMLATFEALREQGVDAHRWGRTLLALPVPPAPPEGADAVARMEEEARQSQRDAAPEEFVFEMTPEDADSTHGMNVRSCAVCHLFSRHDAMDLVPYMCAMDDVMSDARGQGLRRTGTIALGASHCDFRFRAGGEPLRLVEQYPDRIRVGEPADDDPGA